MALDEAMRHRIHGQLEELLGHEEAAALMAELPAQELATRADLVMTRTDIEHTIETLGLKLERSMSDLASTLRTEMNQQYRWTVQWVVGSLLAAGSLGIAAGNLLAG
jgi:hypothetical protein